MTDHERMLFEDAVQYAIESEQRYLKMRKLAMFLGGLSFGLFCGVIFFV